ncbi:MAG: ribonuclease HII [Nitrospira sp.]|nr:ribonuclease HII [Nitrospira sp.]
MATLISVASGKGGVGKSIVSVNLALALAKAGRKVILADLDVGGADAHIMFGELNPPVTLTDLGPADEFEQEARRCGYRRIAGLDEAGRGPLAGPVVAAAVILPVHVRLVGVDDSKQLSEAERERLYPAILEKAVGVGIGVADPGEIDTLNILEATRLAMRRAIENLVPLPDYLLTDAVILPDIRIPLRPIIKGDALSLSIAAASIIAKVTRDRLMAAYHERFPQYNFLSHKGYGTAEHLQRLAQFGPCSIHRRTFAPVREVILSAPAVELSMAGPAIALP